MRIVQTLLSTSAVLMTACQSAPVLDRPGPASGAAEPASDASYSCDNAIYIIGEFKKTGEFPFEQGMTALDALEMAERTYRYRVLSITRDGASVQYFGRSASREELSQFRLKPCDILRGLED